MMTSTTLPTDQDVSQDAGALPRRLPTHYHLSASTQERLLALDEIHGTYLGALAEARRLAVEAKPATSRRRSL
jgi:hypothetical protein